jgi:mannosyltransferase OCH1-like enzyme
MNIQMFIILFIILIIFIIFHLFMYNYESFMNNNNKIKINNIFNNQVNNNEIPKIIIQTYKNNYVNSQIALNIQNILKLNPNYNYLLITDKDAENLISSNFDNDVYQAYLKLNVGAAKGDFIRYIALYLYGGVYIDLDSSITINLDTFIDYNLDFIFFYDHAYNLMNTPIITKKRNPILMKLIHEVSKRINNNEQNIFIATGPTVFTDVVYNEITHENIYNVSKYVNEEKRKKIWLANKYYKNGMIVYKNKGFKFRMDNYSNDLLYDNNDKYKVTYNSATPNLYK